MTEMREMPGHDVDMEKPASVIAGFQLLKRVGRGGMGTVYKAKQVSVDRIVAVKVLRPSLARNESFISRFKEEAKAAAKLNHPQVVQAIDAGEDSGYYYFAMEFVDGETLHRLMLREGVISEKQGLKIGLDVAQALSHAHQQGIVHRDIKPGNIMISRDGVTKLCDLGLARVEEEEIAAGGRGAAVGTPYYISPEQATGRLDVDCRSDIYSLGATLYRALVGKPAFDAPTPAEILEKHVRTPLPWPRDHNPALSENICYLIAKMMAKKPEERYQTPDELIEDLKRVMAGEAPKSAVVKLEMPPARLTPEERKADALTEARLRKKKQAVRQLAQVRNMVDQVVAEQGIPPHAVVRLLRGNLDEQKPETFLKYGVMLLAERRFHLARREFHQAALLGMDVSKFMAKLDALGAPSGMVYVPAGEFLLGPPEKQEKVTLAAFYIDVNLVTCRKYHDFLRAVPNAVAPGHWINREIPQGQEDYPVMNITWEEAHAYVEWAGKRLPGVAEWQKASRGADGRRYPWGNEFDPLRCNTAESGINDLTVAGRYPRGASPYGCLDMFGNVVQWCEDEGAIGPEEPHGRAVCGISWEEPGASAGCWRVEFRKRVRRSRKCGFRCAMSL